MFVGLYWMAAFVSPSMIVSTREMTLELWIRCVVRLFRLHGLSRVSASMEVPLYLEMSDSSGAIPLGSGRSVATGMTSFDSTTRGSRPLPTKGRSTRSPHAHAHSNRSCRNTTNPISSLSGTDIHLGQGFCMPVAQIEAQSKSPYADFRHAGSGGGRCGGSTLLLAEFIWAHHGNR